MTKTLGSSSLIILILSLYISCTYPNSTAKIVEKEEAKIVSMFIDELAIPFPLPPIPSKNNFEESIKNTNWDSIKKVPTTIVLDTIMFNTSENLDLPPKFDQFQILVDSIRNLPSKSMDKDKITSEEGHHIIFGNSLEDFRGQYPQIIFTSRIVLNENNDRAAIYAGHSSGKLAGYLNLYLLEKKEDKWQIVFKKNVEVS